MQTCGTCRHWAAVAAACVETDLLKATRGGEVEAGWCQHLGYRSERARILSCEDAEFISLADFGCIAHEPRDD